MKTDKPSLLTFVNMTSAKTDITKYIAEFDFQQLCPICLDIIDEHTLSIIVTAHGHQALAHLDCVKNLIWGNNENKDQEHNQR